MEGWQDPEGFFTEGRTGWGSGGMWPGGQGAVPEFALQLQQAERDQLLPVREPLARAAAVPSSALHTHRRAGGPERSSCRSTACPLPGVLRPCEETLVASAGNWRSECTWAEPASTVRLAREPVHHPQLRHPHGRTRFMISAARPTRPPPRPPNRRRRTSKGRMSDGGPSTCSRGRGSPWASIRSGTSSSSSPCSRTRPQ